MQRDAEALREPLTTFYLSSNGFFFPQRFPAKFGYLRTDNHAGRAFDVVEIMPSGGSALEYWFERRSHLLLRIVDRKGASPTIVEASDYRTAGGIRVAFKLTVTSPDGTILDRGTVTSLVCSPADSESYDPPAR